MAEGETKEEYEARVAAMQEKYSLDIHGNNAKLCNIILVIGWDDNFKCGCGNHASSSGLYPCDFIGESVEPYPKLWPMCLYKCADCGQIFLDVTYQVK